MRSLLRRDPEFAESLDSGDAVFRQSRECRPLVPARRLFCLITVFDFLAALIIWLLYANALKEALQEKLREEVLRYKIKRSLFDVVVLALCRMLILLLVYALCVSRKWYCIAMSTTVTTAFVVAKAVLITSVSSGGNNPLFYVLVLSSLVLSWVEAWIFDTKVIPSEVEAEQRHHQDVETRSLLNSQHRGHHTAPSLFSEHSFYTPEGSDTESDVDDLEQPAMFGPSAQDRELIETSKQTMAKTWQLMGLNDGWNTEKEKDGITVESRFIASGRKIFRLKSSIEGKAVDIFNIIVLHPEMAHKWGGSITNSYVVRRIDEQTDIVYNSTGEEARGMVSCRDFVNLRRWERRGDVFVSCNSTIVLDDLPPKTDHVRGENGPGGWAFKEAEGNPNRTEYMWLFDVDLKGWLPQSVIDIAMSHMLFRTGQGVRSYVRETLAERQ
ncbi:stAR-related lipid transfer protein 3-like [Acropora muricata]|uniref:stAR-related lipid transfer protein 3-like n=1 Tax=Acropora muricata TaxID=159855 RepID=UPI0034E4E2F6